MDPRIETITRDGSALVGEYVARVTVSSVKFLDTLLGNVATLVAGVIEQGAEVVSAATTGLFDDEAKQD